MSDAAVLAQGASPMPGSLRLFWRSFAENRGAVLGLSVMVILLLLAVFADVVAPHSPIEQYRDHFLTPPMWQEGGTTVFPLGTDDVGRDVLARLIYGARLSLLIGIAVVSLSLACGIVLGLTAAFAGGLVDTAIMRLMDVVLVFPSLLLARDYVTATRCAGAGRLHLMFNTVLPNCLAPLIVQATLGFATAILDAAALGFLGLGAQPPTPEWGTMLAGALQFYQRAWWVLTFPGLAILLTVLAFNLFGDGLRDALDPRLKH